MCREVVSTLKRLKEQRDMTLNEVGAGAGALAACRRGSRAACGARHGGAAPCLPAAALTLTFSRPPNRGTGAADGGD